VYPYVVIESLENGKFQYSLNGVPVIQTFGDLPPELQKAIAPRFATTPLFPPTNPSPNQPSPPEDQPPLNSEQRAVLGQSQLTELIKNLLSYPESFSSPSLSFYAAEQNLNLLLEFKADSPPTKKPKKYKVSAILTPDNKLLDVKWNNNQY